MDNEPIKMSCLEKILFTASAVGLTSVSCLRLACEWGYLESGPIMRYLIQDSVPHGLILSTGFLASKYIGKKITKNEKVGFFSGLAGAVLFDVGLEALEYFMESPSSVNNFIHTAANFVHHPNIPQMYHYAVGVVEKFSSSVNLIPDMSLGMIFLSPFVIGAASYYGIRHLVRKNYAKTSLDIKS
jgi:hypothetical protein